MSRSPSRTLVRSSGDSSLPDLVEEILLIASDARLVSEMANALSEAGLQPKVRVGEDRGGGTVIPKGVACVVQELRFPGPSPSVVVRSLRQGPVRAPVILVAESPPVAAVVEAMKAGAFDVFELPVNPLRLVERVWEAIAIRRTTLADVADVQRVESLLDSLTRRERQLLDLLIGGMSTKEIAYELGIREVTVDFHRRNVYKKMGAENAVQLSRNVEQHRHLKDRLAG